MAGPDRKMSEVMKEMAEQVLLGSSDTASDEAMHAALFFANVAWNECVGINHARESHRNVLKTFEASNPALWDDLKSSDVDALIDELVRYKQAHYPDDQRRILACGIPNGNIRVEWLAAAAPGVDSKWEMQLYGLVRSGDRPGAIRFLQKSSGLPRNEAKMRVATIAAALGVK